MLGQEVTTLFSGITKAGRYTLNWDGTDGNGKQASSGSYIYRMSAGEFIKSKKMILIK
jgi:flagellar hook assembly protein FlgD